MAAAGMAAGLFTAMRLPKPVSTLPIKALAGAARPCLALLLPFVALALQWPLWPWIRPFVWFLFYPAIFFSARIDGLRGGILGAILSAALVWYFFLPPQLSWALVPARAMYSIGAFLLMGVLFGLVHRRLARLVAASKTALWESEERYRNLFMNSHSVMLMVEPTTGQIVQANPAAARFYGWPAERLCGRSVAELNTLPPDRTQENLRRVREREVDYFLTRHRLADETVRDVEVYSCPVQDHDQILLFSILHDVTERRQAEEALHDSRAKVQLLNSELERRVQERTGELQAANAELESFAYAVSHDLRAPLRAMSGFSQALVEDLGPRLEATERAYLDHIVGASARMSDLIDGILQLSRATRGELTREWIDLTALAKRLLGDLGAAEPGRAVEWTVQPGLRAWGAVRLVEALLGNLLNNAWKYTAGRAPAVIRLTGGGDRFTLEDNGAGFDMAYADKLFQPFQRLHRQDEFPGLGIGLATVQRIVHRHGGRIEARAEVGRGATFTFTLPGPGESPA